MHVWNVLLVARCKHRTQKIDKNSPSAHDRTILSGSVFATKVSTIGKIRKQQYVFHMSSQYGELRPTNDWDRFRSLRHPNKFQRVSRLAFVIVATSLTGGQPNIAQDVWPSPIHFMGLLPSDAILPGAKFTLHPSLAFSYIDSVAERYASSGRQPNFAAW